MVGFFFARVAPFLFFVWLLAGCSGSDGNSAPGSGGSGTAGTGGTRMDGLKTGLFGTVQAADGRPLQQATVVVAGARAMTDANGDFVIAISRIGDEVVRFGADGYLPAVRRVTIVDGKPTAAHVILKEREVAQQLTADTGGTVTGVRQAAVTIEPGDLSGSKETSVTGMVDVYVTPVDPSDGNEVQALTASFDDGVDLLESFGMVDVTIMQGAEELDVAEGETLEIRIPAPAGTSSSELPESMPLWSLDEETGRWVEEGTLTLDPPTNTYVGEVSHLSAWNADVRATATCIAGVAVDEAGDPVPGAAVDTKGVDYSGSSATNTGDDGRFYVAVRKSSRVSVSVVHAAGGGETRDVDSSGDDTNLPPAVGDPRCLDVGTFTIEREVPPSPPSCVPMICEDTGDECTVGQCNAETGNCDVTDVTDGTECDDGVGRCSAGECIDLCEDVECPSENECMQDGTCGPNSGDCIDGNDEPVDTPCGDAFVCDGAGECVECNEASQCLGGDQCNDPICPDNFCDTDPIMNGTPCDLVGMGDGICDVGNCVTPPACLENSDCDDDNDCSINQCIDSACDTISVVDLEPCDLVGIDDGVCAMGQCVESLDDPACDDGNECTTDVCNSENGSCSNDGVPDGTDCRGSEGMCSGGECIPEPSACPGGAFFCEDFESGPGPWFPDNGVWEIGEATAGPESCFGGSGCAGTVLAGDHPRGRASRLISGVIVLPGASGDEELHLRFWNWFAFGNDGFGRSTTAEVQISVLQADGTFGSWVTVTDSVVGQSAVWSIKDADLSAYAGETVRIGFLINGNGGSGPGWYIDDIEIVAKAPELTPDFEGGWGDWSASRGVWEIGEATAGPAGCFEGSGCAGAVLGGDHPRGQGSRLTSATTTLPTVSGIGELRLQFQNWFAFGRDGFGRSTTADVQISILQTDGTFGTWVSVGDAAAGASSDWELRTVILTEYAGETARIGFLINGNGGSGPGWYIDDIEFLTF